MAIYYILIYIAVILAATGQIFLKLGSGQGGVNLGLMQVNLWIVLGCAAMTVSMLLNIRALSVVPLRDMAFILPMVYVLVPLFSRILLGERVTQQTITGTVIIILGVGLFNIPSMRLF